MENKKSITVCVPLYNEEDVVEQLSNKLKKLDKNLDGIVNSKFLLVLVKWDKTYVINWV